MMKTRDRTSLRCIRSHVRPGSGVAPIALIGGRLAGRRSGPLNVAVGGGRAGRLVNDGVGIVDFHRAVVAVAVLVAGDVLHPAEDGLAGDADLDPRGHGQRHLLRAQLQDRKSTRLNSSHVEISYAVFCLKKKKKNNKKKTIIKKKKNNKQNRK